MVKVIFYVIRNFSLGKKIAPSGIKFFPLREASIMKTEAIELNH